MCHNNNNNMFHMNMNYVCISIYVKKYVEVTICNFCPVKNARRNVGCVYQVLFVNINCVFGNTAKQDEGAIAMRKMLIPKYLIRCLLRLVVKKLY